MSFGRAIDSHGTVYRTSIESADGFPGKLQGTTSSYGQRARTVGQNPQGQGGTPTFFVIIGFDRVVGSSHTGRGARIVLYLTARRRGMPSMEVQFLLAEGNKCTCLSCWNDLYSVDGPRDSQTYRQPRRSCLDTVTNDLSPPISFARNVAIRLSASSRMEGLSGLVLVWGSRMLAWLANCKVGVGIVRPKGPSAA